MKNTKIKNKLFDPGAVKHAEVLSELVEESSPRKIFLLLIFISSVTATFGLLNDSASVVIGAMLVAPLLWPILGLSMGILLFDARMARMSLLSIFLSILIAVVTAMVITFFYVPLGASREILQVTTIGFMFPVALSAGAAAAFAICYESVKEIVTGIAISVALLPPLVTVGIGLGATDWNLMESAMKLFGINLVGILGISMIIFTLLKFRGHKRALEVDVRKEEKILVRK